MKTEIKGEAWQKNTEEERKDKSERRDTKTENNGEAEIVEYLTWVLFCLNTAADLRVTSPIHKVAKEGQTGLSTEKYSEYWKWCQQ